MTKPRTSAEKYLVRRQRFSPPRYPYPKQGPDYALQLYWALSSWLPKELQTLVTNGTLAIGQVGRNIPDLRTLAIPPNGFVIEMTSGLLDFNYALAFALAKLNQQETPMSDAPLTVKEVSSLAEGVLRKWGRYMRWSSFFPWRLRVRPDRRTISEKDQDWIDLTTESGELFMLAHELAHVALDAKLVEPLSDNDEDNADRYGYKFYLPAAIKRWHPRMALAGPLYPIRVFAALQGLGVEFTDHYLPPFERVRALREEIRATCRSDQHFHEITTVLVANLDLMDDIANHIAPQSSPLVPDIDRMVARYIAELEEVAKGTVSLATFVENIGYLAKGTPRQIMKDAAEIVVGYYGHPPGSEEAFLSVSLRTKMYERLKDLIQALPLDLSDIFPSIAPTATS